MARAQAQAKKTAAPKAKATKAAKAPRLTKADNQAAEVFVKMLQQSQSVTVPNKLANRVAELAEEAKVENLNRVDGADTTRFVREIKRRDGRMARSKTITKFGSAIEAAIAAGRKNKQGIVAVTHDDIINATLGETWLKTQHGWKDNMTCGRAAIANGYPNYRLQTNKDPSKRRVLLAPEGVEIPNDA